MLFDLSLRHDEGLDEPVYEVMSYLGGAKPSWRRRSRVGPVVHSGGEPLELHDVMGEVLLRCA